MRKLDFWTQYIPEPNTGCWLWSAGYGAAGYGGARLNGRCEGAHRVAYILAVGPIPSGMSVCHRCDTRGCINPDHLFLGTVRDNLTDMRAKGRQARGEKLSRAVSAGLGGTAVLSDTDIKAIRASSESSAELGRRYRQTASNIAKIRHHETWKHVA